MSKEMSLILKSIIVNITIFLVLIFCLSAQEVEIRPRKSCGGKRIENEEDNNHNKDNENINNKAIQNTFPHENKPQKEIIIERPKIIAKLRYIDDWKENPHALRNLLLFMEKSLKISAIDIKSDSDIVLTDKQKLSIFDQLSDFEVNLNENANKDIIAPILSGDIPFDDDKDDKLTTFKVLSEDKEIEASSFPLLYMTGHNDFSLDENKINAIRSYIYKGGILFGDCSSGEQNFKEGFTKLCLKLFPDKKLESLPDNHPLFYSFYNLKTIRYTGRIKPENGHNLKGIKVGCKTAVIFSPDAVSCGWDGHMHGEYIDHEMHYDDARKLGVNLIAYALGYRELGFDTSKLKILKFEKEYIFDNFAFTQVEFKGDWDTNIFGINEFINYVAENTSIDLYPARVVVNPLKDDISKYPFLFISGHGNPNFNENFLKSFKEFFQNDGVLFAEACCGDKEFEESIRQLATSIYPKNQFIVLDISHPIFNIFYNLESLQYTPKGLLKLKDLLKKHYSEQKTEKFVREKKPYLEALIVNRNVKIIFSPLDLSCAWTKQPCLTCEGISHKDLGSFKLGVNILTYILTRYDKR